MMREEKIDIKNGSSIIEALWSGPSAKKGAVICHPHSLMGGSMYNNVVETIQESFAAAEISTLRFNFRGVGESTGRYDEGRGEREDILVVCDYLRSTGLQKLFFAGYSFGAWVGSKIYAEKDDIFSFTVFVSPPINYFDFEWDQLKGKINLLVCGDQDGFCSVDIVKRRAQDIHSRLEIISGADHFYRGREKDLAKSLQKYIL
jgi:hypothetical protein